MREFAEQEIVIPTGKWQGQRYKCHRQPYAGLYFDAVDSGKWREIAALGPSQTGKTLTCFVIPLLYHLFEYQETVVCGVPSLEMVRDKWQLDILPVIARTKYRDYLPTHGPGSKGGQTSFVQFGNGSVLRFMTGGGDDKARAAFTARVLAITEVDGLAVSDSTSAEANKIKQLEARLRSFGSDARIYKECTVTTEEGHIWQRYTAGTKSQILLPCVHCGQFCLPERESLLGWQEADDEHEAMAKSQFYCTACGEAWTDEQRIEANAKGILVHRGQTAEPDRTIVGEDPKTTVLGFRWTGTHNTFQTAGDYGRDEFNARLDPDEDNAEKEMCQFVWAQPHSPLGWDTVNVNPDKLRRRQRRKLTRGLVPANTILLGVGCDIGKRLAHWTCMAFLDDNTAHVVDYSRFQIASDELGFEKALMLALREFRDACEEGWTCADGSVMAPEIVVIDANGFKDVPVYAFIRESDNDVYLGSWGKGAGMYRSGTYSRPKSTGAVVKKIAERCHVEYLPSTKVFTAVFDADYWKMWLHRRFMCPIEQPGAITMFSANPQEHYKFANHISAERYEEVFEPGKGKVGRFTPIRSQNHWLDSTALCGVGASLRDIQMAIPRDEPPPAPVPDIDTVPATDGDRRMALNFSGQHFVSRRDD